MKREAVTIVVSALVTLLTALLMLRWLAPQLLGVPPELRMVQIAKEVPPFFEGVFRATDLESHRRILEDPLTHRARPLLREWSPWGPHDLLGFRNRAIPTTADIVAIGDSQTYSNNVLLEQSWPHALVRSLGVDGVSIYNIAVGGWGPIDYLEMASKALAFRPQVLIIALYTGNDALDAFRKAYSLERWAHLRSGDELTATSAPRVKYPPPESEWWPVTFRDGSKTIFTPQYRLAANDDHPAVREGFAIIANVASHIVRLERADPVRIVFTVIPTKELVYEHRVARDRLDPPAPYRLLVRAERQNIEALAATITALEDCTYIDLLADLQQAALGEDLLYPSDDNGHPSELGYAAIGRMLASRVGAYLSAPPSGFFVADGGPKKRQAMLVRDGRVWVFRSLAIAREHGWSLERAPVFPQRLVANLPRAGMITAVDRERFGP